MNRSYLIVCHIAWLLAGAFTFSVRGHGDEPGVEFRASLPGPFRAVHWWQGSLWVGTDRGLYRCPDEITTVPVPGVQGAVLCFTDDGPDLLVGGTNGLLRFRTPAGPAPAPELPDATVNCVQRIGEDLWVGCGTGLRIITKDGTPILRLTNVPVSSLAVIGRTVAVGTNSDIKEFDVTTRNEVPESKLDENLFENVKGTGVSALYFYRDTLWGSVGSAGDSNRADNPGQFFRMKIGNPSSTTVTNVTGLVYQFVHKAETLWIAAENGLFRVDRSHHAGATVDTMLTMMPAGALCLGDGKLWVAGERLYHISVFEYTGWDPKIKFSDLPCYLGLTGRPFTIRWRIGDYAGRTTSSLVKSTFRLVSDTGKPAKMHAVEHQNDEFMATITPQASGTSRFYIEGTDLSGVAFRSPNFFVFFLPLWAILIASIAVALVLLILTHRWILTHLRLAEWTFDPKGCDRTVEVKVVSVEDQARELAFGLSDKPGAYYATSDGGSESIAQAVRGMTVVVEVPEPIFDDLVANRIRGPVFNQPNPTIAGQLCLRAILKEDQQKVWIKSITATSLGCLLSSHRNDQTEFPLLPVFNPKDDLDQARAERINSELIRGRTFRRLTGWCFRPNSLVDIVTEQFERWGARTSVLDEAARAEATSVDFLRSLSRADVVHVLAHGRPDGLVFQDRCLSVGELDRQLSQCVEPLRCRLLILSACDTGMLRQGLGAFVFPLVRRGVTILAASSEFDYPLSIRFYRAFYGALFPKWRSSGITIGDALRAAVAACASRSVAQEMYGWGRDIDSLVLFGDPSVRFRFRFTTRLWMDRFRDWWRAMVSRLRRRSPS